SRPVARACAATTAGSRSQKTRRGQSGVRQRKRRAETRRATRRPCQGRAAAVRTERLWTPSAAAAQAGGGGGAAGGAGGRPGGCGGDADQLRGEGDGGDGQAGAGWHQIGRGHRRESSCERGAEYGGGFIVSGVQHQVRYCWQIRGIILHRIPWTAFTSTGTED